MRGKSLPSTTCRMETKFVALVLALGGPLIGLFGVGLGIWFGQKRWRQEAKGHDAEFYQAKRREAYVGLWEVVQAAHLRMRQSLRSGLGSSVSVFLTDVNAFGWKNGIYIEDEDQKLALEYLFIIYEFLRLVVQHDGMREWVASTAPLPRHVPSTVETMKLAEDEANSIRDELVRRIKTVLIGSSVEIEAQQLPETISQAHSTGQAIATQFATLIQEHADREVAEFLEDPPLLPDQLQPPPGLPPPGGSTEVW